MTIARPTRIVLTVAATWALAAPAAGPAAACVLGDATVAATASAAASLETNDWGWE